MKAGLGHLILRFKFEEKIVFLFLIRETEFIFRVNLSLIIK